MSEAAAASDKKIPDEFFVPPIPEKANVAPATGSTIASAATPAAPAIAPVLEKPVAKTATLPDHLGTLERTLAANVELAKQVYAKLTNVDVNLAPRPAASSITNRVALATDDANALKALLLSINDAI